MGKETYLWKVIRNTFWIIFHSMYENLFGIFTVSDLERGELKNCGRWCLGFPFPGLEYHRIHLYANELIGSPWSPVVLALGKLSQTSLRFLKIILHNCLWPNPFYLICMNLCFCISLNCLGIFTRHLNSLPAFLTSGLSIILILSGSCLIVLLLS